MNERVIKQMKKTPLEEIQRLCEEKNWTLLDVFVNGDTSMRWKCNLCDYEWKTSYQNAKKKQGCCRGGIVKISREMVQKLCDEKNWTLLDTFVNNETSMRWKCNSCEYEWKTSYNNATNKMGCCNGGKRHYDDTSVQAVANKKGFKLISPYTHSVDNNLWWECLTCEYQWRSDFGNINREERQGCPRCNNSISRYRFDEVKEIAFSKNLTCLSAEYIDSNTTMEWKCDKCDREWKTTFRSIVQNIGCIRCTFDETIKLDIQTVKERLKHRDELELVSTEYVNSQTNMEWRCLKCDNTWLATYSHVQHSNSGCPNCAAYKSQKMCRKIFEELIGLQFPTRRPKLLNRLEYDGFAESINLAFEYQGYQHYRYIEFLQRKIENFDKQVANDAQKIELSEKNGITLIHVPYTYSHRAEEKLRRFITKRLYEEGFLESPLPPT